MRRCVGQLTEAPGRRLTLLHELLGERAPAMTQGTAISKPESSACWSPEASLRPPSSTR